MKIKIKTFLLVLTLVLFFISKAQEKPGASAQELADKLSNPVAKLISVPFQSNVDYGIGPYHGSKYTMNFQPVVPIVLTPILNLITRYIVPIVDQHDITAEGASQFGLSDATISAWFSPSIIKNGFIWGAGPAFLLPLGTNDALSTRKWAAGPTALALKQRQGITFGFLVNQLWSFAGDKNRSSVNQMFLQPFFSKSWKSGASISANSEITFNWQTGTTTAFINPLVNGVTRLGKQTISIGVGPRISVGNPADFGFRGVLTFVFPK